MAIELDERSREGIYNRLRRFFQDHDSGEVPLADLETLWEDHKRLANLVNNK